MIKKIQIAKPYIDKNDKKSVMEVLNSGWLSLGPKYKLLEQKFTEYTNTKYACAVSSGTSGLHLMVKSLGIGPGDEVITTPFSFIASSNCILYVGAKPVFVDIEETSFNIDPAKIEAAITKKTKAILVVHIFGQSADMTPILKIARKHHLKIIEDSCESIGALYKGKMTGTFGDAGIYSFYPNKQMTTGEGAVIVTNSKTMYENCDSWRNQGRPLNPSKKGADWDWLTSERLGYNYRMDEMSAALGVTQLAKLEWMIDQKRQVVDWYQQYLTDIPGVLLPQVAPKRTHTWFVYVVRIQDDRRDEMMKKLLEIGIQVRPYLPVIHLQPFMKAEFGFKVGDYPVAELVAAETLALPFYIGLKKSEVKYIASQIKKILK